MFEGDSQILLGQVGWEDEDEYEFVGSDDNDGHTLVRVQLFEGRDLTRPLNPNRAQGYKLACHLSGHITRTPPKNTRVYVAVPKGMEHVDGAGVIFATIEKRPREAGNLNVDETCIRGPEGSGSSVVFKKDGSISIVSGVGSNTVTLTVKPTGITFASPYGSFVLDPTGYHLKTKAGPRIDMGGLSIPGVPAAVSGALTGYATITAPNVKLAGGFVWLGVGTEWVNPYTAPMNGMDLPISGGLAGTPALLGPATAVTPGQVPTIRIAVS